MSKRRMASTCARGFPALPSDATPHAAIAGRLVESPAWPVLRSKIENHHDLILRGVTRQTRQPGKPRLRRSFALPATAVRLSMRLRRLKPRDFAVERREEFDGAKSHAP
jgi:hypothetical protein